MTTTLLRGIGTLYTGDLAAPRRTDVAALRLVDGRIDALLGPDDDPGPADEVLDAKGMTVAPGLIDSHCHVVLGDYTPRQKTVDFLDSYVHGGITSVVSPGEIHAPGRGHEPVAVKALAVTAAHLYRGFRPTGMKVHAGSVVVEPTLTAADFEELRASGVRFAKVGFGAVTDPYDYVEPVAAARAAGILVMAHCGGASLPGSRPIAGEHLLAIRPHVCGHVNGGTTSLTDDDVAAIVHDTDMVLQVVQAGNLRSALHVVATARAAGATHRIVLGSDTPTGTGVMPLALLKTIAELASLGGIDPAEGWAYATGSNARAFGLEGQGVVAPGAAADLVLLDAPLGCTAGDDADAALRNGDLPGIAGVLIDGELVVRRSRNTVLAARQLGDEVVTTASCC